MAVRQYIGARYVLKIYENSLDPQSANWEAGVEYEPLVMVNYNNSSYISRKQVPANIGDPVSNPTYWALSGLYNGQIANLQNEINALDLRVTNNEGELDELNSRVPITNDYICYIGDSFVQASSLGVDQDKRFSTLVANRLGLTEKNYAVGGTGYVTGTTWFATQATNAVNDFTTNNLDPLRVKYFVVAGGGNDGYVAPGDSTAFFNAIKSTLNTIKNYFTNAQIIVIPYLWKGQWLPQNHLEAIGYIHQACFEVSEKIRIVEDAYTWMCSYYKYILYQSGAMVHPNVEGHKIFAEHVYSAILGNNYHTPSYFQIPVTFNANLDTANCKAEVDNDGRRIHLRVVIKGGAADLTGSVDLYSMTRNDFNSMRSMFMGAQIIYCEPMTRNAGVVKPECYLESSVTMTGDGEGSWTTHLRKYQGDIKAGETYIFDLTIPFGVTYGDQNP